MTFESDWRAAKASLSAILEEHAEKVDEAEFHRAAELLHVQFVRLTPVIWVSTAPEGVKLTMRYLCRPRARRVSTSTMWEAILDAFEHLPGVDFAYPTQRRFDQAVEGKPSLRRGTPRFPLPDAVDLAPGRSDPGAQGGGARD